MVIISQFYRPSTEKWETFDSIFDLSTTIKRTEKMIEAGNEFTWRIMEVTK